MICKGEIDWEKENITKLGIDEHSFRGKRMVITITDLKNKKLLKIIMLLETSDYSGYLSTFKRTFKRWRIPILNYFKNRTTNGFTEGCHTKIKMIKRVSYGFRNINNYIAKVTLGFLPFALVVGYHTF